LSSPMPLSKREIEELVRLVALTRNDEIDCEQCLALVAEFAERQLAGRSKSEVLETVEHHLAICSECHEEYEALRRTLEGMEG